MCENYTTYRMNSHIAQRNRCDGSDFREWNDPIFFDSEDALINHTARKNMILYENITGKESIAKAVPIQQKQIQGCLPKHDGHFGSTQLEITSDFKRNKNNESSQFGAKPARNEAKKWIDNDAGSIDDNNKKRVQGHLKSADIESRILNSVEVKRQAKIKVQLIDELQKFFNSNTTSDKKNRVAKKAENTTTTVTNNLKKKLQSSIKALDMKNENFGQCTIKQPAETAEVHANNLKNVIFNKASNLDNIQSEIKIISNKYDIAPLKSSRNLKQSLNPPRINNLTVRKQLTFPEDFVKETEIRNTPRGLQIEEKDCAHRVKYEQGKKPQYSTSSVICHRDRNYLCFKLNEECVVGVKDIKNVLSKADSSKWVNCEDHNGLIEEMPRTTTFISKESKDKSKKYGLNGPFSISTRCFLPKQNITN